MLTADGSFSYNPAPGYAGPDSFTYEANDGQASSNVATVAITVNPVAQATPMPMDATTQGGWKGTYGGDGFVIPADPGAEAKSTPAYASLSVSGAIAGVWDDSTTDPRAVQVASPVSTQRIAPFWYSATAFSIDVRLPTGPTHQLAIYALDDDGFGGGRSERIDILDSRTGAVLDSETLDDFRDGVYLAWDLSGAVTIRVTNLNPDSNAVLSGIFFDPAV